MKKSIPAFTIAIVITALFAVASARLLRAQSQAQPSGQSNPKFAPFVYDVVSIKPSSNGRGSPSQSSADGVSMRNFSVQMLIQRAYGVQDFQVDGASGWISSEKFDVEAKMDDAVAAAFGKLGTDDKILARQLMLQAILADRFKLQVHRETRQIPVFFLEVAKKGLKVHEAKPGDTYANGIKTPNGQKLGPVSVMFSMTPQGETMQAQGVPISMLLSHLMTMRLGRPIQDKTGLTGNYDFTLTWSPETAMPASVPDGSGVPTASDPAGASIFTALKEQLGLELVPAKGEVEFIVIEHVDRATAN
ncbi:MAG TPA: TIGR03435 family protein [Candidatus Acidoferrales bacterium]|nr:TIGR03435 family protein [Candidatus Acidoferrales bacterium]